MLGFWIGNSHDYGDFGVMLAGRGFSGGGSDYGYQGSRRDDEIAGSGAIYQTEWRQLDVRLGRWFSCDPIFQPWQSPYTAMDNNPINITDVLGLSGDDISINGKTYERTTLAGPDADEAAKNEGNWETIDFGNGITGLGHANSDGTITTFGVDKSGKKTYYKLKPSTIARTQSGIGQGGDSEYGGGNSGKPAQNPTRPSGVTDKEWKEVQYQINKDTDEDNEELFDEMTDVFEVVWDLYSFEDSDEFEEDAWKVLNQFYSGSGGTASGLTGIEDVVKDNSTFKNLQNGLSNAISNHLRAGGSLTNLDLSAQLSNPNLGATSDALKTILGGTQSAEVIFQSVKATNDQMHYTFKLVIKDEFGVDEGDIDKAGGFSGVMVDGDEGIANMWILQHQRGRKPVVIELNFNFTVTVPK